MAAIFAVNACWFVRVVAKGSVQVRSPFFLIIFECYCNYLHVANAHKKNRKVISLAVFTGKLTRFISATAPKRRVAWLQLR